MALPNIVQLTVNQALAPTPNNYQQLGALLSQGGTSLTPGTYQILTQASDATSIIKPKIANTAVTFSSGTVTVTTTSNHGLAAGDKVVVQNVVPTAYNGVFTVASAPTSTEYTYALGGSPATVTTLGTSQAYVAGEVQAMVNTYFAQGSYASVYILELGAGTPAEGVSALAEFELSYPKQFYQYLTPRSWTTDTVEPTFLTFAAQYESASAQKYFYVTSDLTTYTEFNAQLKCIMQLIEAPTVVPYSEFSMAGVFWNTLSANPSPSNPVAPLSYRYVVGVTAYPITSQQLALFKASNLNWIMTGSEGGISNTMLCYGNMLDGNPWNYWYSADWSQINIELDLANEIINGSNSTNPLYYNQQGINRLQNRLVNTVTRGVSYGLILGNPVGVQQTQQAFNTSYDQGAYAGEAVVNAVPFVSWNQLNPSSYKLGQYGGFTVVLIPARGFEQITVQLTISQFVA